MKRGQMNEMVQKTKELARVGRAIFIAWSDVTHLSFRDSELTLLVDFTYCSLGVSSDK